MNEDLAPLDDPAYDPMHKPVDGVVPDVVAKWGPRSQVRWFDRFHRQIKAMPPQEWNRFYCESVQHRGQCCMSCIEDAREGYCDWDRPTDPLRPVEDERCCCYVLKEAE